MNSTNVSLEALRAEVERQQHELDGVCDAMASAPDGALVSEESFERVQRAFRAVPTVGPAVQNFMRV